MDQHRPSRSPIDIANLKMSVALDGTVVLEEAVFPEGLSVQQRNEAKARLMAQLTETMAPRLKERGIDARFVWRSEIEKA